jgi:hypothetical protein
MTRKIAVLTVLLSMRSTSYATVEIGITDLGNQEAAITYTCTAGEPIRAFALDITVDAGTVDYITGFKVGESVSGDLGYGIFPGTFRDYIDPAAPSWNEPNYTPVAPSGDPDALPGLGTAAVTVELASLYVDANAPPASGTLCILGVTDGCNMCAVLNASRGGIILEDPNSVPSPVLACGVWIEGGCNLNCWMDPLGASQCHGDVNGDLIVNTSDWPAFRDSFLKTYPDPAYNPCADYNRDGTVNTSDFPAFRDNFLKTVAPDCEIGGTWPPIP